MQRTWLVVGVVLALHWVSDGVPAALGQDPAHSPKQPTLTEVQADVVATKSELATQRKLLEELRASSEATHTLATDASSVGKARGDIAWMLTASAFVMLMVPGLALFYGGMVRRKNILATMMQSMAALAIVGVYWVIIGYALAFGPSVIKVNLFGVTDAGLIGWSWQLVFVQGIPFDAKLPGYGIPIYLHVVFQGMFAILTPALISGAIAERIRFWPFCLFMVLWITFVYCPLAHMVWAFDWYDPSVVAAKRGTSPIGLLGRMGALDFAGGTVVHIAAGVAGLACVLVLGKRVGYPKLIAHPNSMVLTLLGAGLLWFGWFGFNGGSAVAGTAQAVSAFAVTQVAAAAGGLGWLVVEWLHRGKPTALGLASGIVAGLVAVTPASGYVYIWAGLFIGLAAAAVCYLAVTLKHHLGYDDSLDAFGVHGVGGFVGAVLTGIFCTTAINPAGGDGLISYYAHRARVAKLTANNQAIIEQAKADAQETVQAAQNAESQLKAMPNGFSREEQQELEQKQLIAADRTEYAKQLEQELATLNERIANQDDLANGGANRKTAVSQLWIQTKAAAIAAIYAFVFSLALAFLTHRITGRNFRTDEKGELDGLDRTEHGEVGFDISGATESVAVSTTEPRRAIVPRGNGRFDVEVIGADPGELMKVWSSLCQPSDEPANPDFLAVYPYVTTVRGNEFRFRGGEPDQLAKHLSNLFTTQLGRPIQAQKK
jgi:ammonium transporter